VGAALLLAVVAAGVAMAYASPFQSVDQAWRDLLADNRSDAATWIARTLSTAGNTIGTTIVGLALASWWLYRRERALAAFVLVAAVVVRIITNLTKYLVGRTRPPEQLVQAVGDSFPSGHVSSATVLAAAVAVVLAQRGRARLGVTLVAVVALVMAWDRTYLSVHWLSDTVAAAALGIGVPLLLWPLFHARTSQRPPIVSTSP
jgi:membrane-associated phospholipid phosphatase